MYLPKYPSVPSSGWLCPCSENNPNNPGLVPMPQDLAGLLRAPTSAQQPRPPPLGSLSILLFSSICLLFTFPALLGLVPCCSDLPSLPGSQVILSQGPSHRTQHGPWLTFQEAGTPGTTVWSCSAAHPHCVRTRAEGKAEARVATERASGAAVSPWPASSRLPSLNLLVTRNK